MMAAFSSTCLLAVLLIAATPARGDLKKARAEQNLEKRSGLALENAADVFKAMRADYNDGNAQTLAGSIAEIQESVELAATSLADTGKNPRKSPKWFKRAEIATRDLLRRLDSFQREMAFDDRSRLEPLKDKVQQIHEDLLLGLMEGKR